MALVAVKRLLRLPPPLHPKLLHPPLVSLRTESRQGPPHGLVDALKRLFQLGE